MLFYFHGGKGVATAFGAIAPISWDLTDLMAGTWLLTVLFSNYYSLGAVVSALISAILRLVAQTVVYLAGIDALLPEFDTRSR